MKIRHHLFISLMLIASSSLIAMEAVDINAIVSETLKDGYNVELAEKVFLYLQAPGTYSACRERFEQFVECIRNQPESEKRDVFLKFSQEHLAPLEPEYYIQG